MTLVMDRTCLFDALEFNRTPARNNVRVADPARTSSNLLTETSPSLGRTSLNLQGNSPQVRDVDRTNG